jgi:hypothetical protein
MALPARRALTICSFCLAGMAETDGARSRTVRGSCAACEPLGLYAEALDAISGRHLGNFPQAFTHLALINAVVHHHRRAPARATRPRT